MELMNEMYKAREAGAAGFARMEGSAGNLPADAGAGRAAHRRRAVDESFGQAVFDPQQAWPQSGRSRREGRFDRIACADQRQSARPYHGPAEASEEEIKSAALASEIVQKYLEGKEPRKVIVANKRLVSIVV